MPLVIAFGSYDSPDIAPAHRLNQRPSAAALPPIHTLRTAQGITPIDSAPRLRNPRVLGGLRRRRPPCHDAIRCVADDYGAAAQCN